MKWPGERHRRPRRPITAERCVVAGTAALAWIGVDIFFGGFQQGGAAAARQAHNLEAGGSNPSPAIFYAPVNPLPSPAYVKAVPTEPAGAPEPIAMPPVAERTAKNGGRR